MTQPTPTQPASKRLVTEEKANATYVPQGELSAQIAADIGNVETPAYSAVQGIVAATIPGAVAIRHDIGSNLAAPRPTYSGPVEWVTTAPEGSKPVSALSGDYIIYVASTPLPWTPARLPSLLAWYDAQALTATADAGVTVVPDLSPNGHNLAVSSGATPPVYRTAGINGHPTLNFSSGHALEVTIPNIVGGAYTVFLVAQTTRETISSSEFIMDGSQAGTALRLSILRHSTAGTFNIQRGTAITGPAAVTTPFRLRSVFYGASSSVALNGGTPVTGTTSTSGLEMNRIVLGGRADGSNRFTGHIGEVIIVRDVVSAADITKVGEYLTARWGLS